MLSFPLGKKGDEEGIRNRNEKERIKEKRKMTGREKGEGKKRKRDRQTDITERRGHDRHLFYWLLAFQLSPVTPDSL